MDEAKKKQMTQIAILVVLLVAMGVIMSTALKPKPAATGATAAAASKPSTRMAEAGITDDLKEAAGGKATGGGGKVRNAQQLNPNMWRVYAIAPPKNPFVQQESWYAETFKRLLPGYPQLAASGFFEKPTEVMPDVNQLFGEDIDFEYVDMDRNFEDQSYVLNGISADGKMQTALKANEKHPDSIHLSFDADGNVIDKQKLLQNKPGRPGFKPDGSAEDPSMPLADGLRLDGLRPESGGGGTGMAVSGVSIHSGKASALMTLNGTSRLVGVGDALTAEYAVTKITGSGVEVKNTETGETKFVTISSPESKDNPAPSMMRGMNL